MKGSFRILASKEGLALKKYACCDPGRTESLLCLPPPENVDEQWMAWNEKVWYPLSIYDESTGKNVSKQVGVRITLTVSFKAVSGVEVDDVSLTTGADKDGIFWFKCINPFLFGVITLTFSEDLKKKSEHIIAPLVSSIKVDKDHKGKGFSDSELVKRDAALETSSAVPAVASSSAPSRKRALSEGGAAPIEKKAVTRKQLMPFISTSDNILPMPSLPPLLTANRRIDRMVGTAAVAASASPTTDASSSSSLSGAATISGPVLQTELSTWLANAIRDDKTQVETYRAMEQWGIDIRPLDQARSNMQRPTSNELFLRLQKAAVQIPESEKSVQLLRNCFECMFENNILYTEEKALFKDKLTSIRNSRSKYADSFGPYYFLRFLVFFVTAADSSTFIDDVGSTSVVRRNAASNRQGKSAFVKFQELIDLAIKDLNENAHHYFA